MNLFGSGKKAKEKVWFEEQRRTYYGSRGEQNDYILGFTLEILQTVCASSAGQGGWYCLLRHMNHTERTFPCFITTTALHKESQFLSELSNTEGMPPVDATNLSSKLLGLYFKWKNEQFVKHCKDKKLKFDKIPVEHRNLQEDGLTFAFGPDLFFERRDGTVVRVDPAESKYSWIPCKLGNLNPLQIATTSSPHILEVIRQKLANDNMPQNFIKFVLSSGYIGFVSLHYKEILKMFNMVPSLVLPGPRATGKTLSTESGASYLGTNALDICVAKELTLSALRQRYTEDHFPLLVHDLKDFSTASTAIQETFEGKPVKKHDTHMVPGCSIAITCNEGQMVYLQQRYEALSRTAVLPMLVQMLRKTAQEREQIQKSMGEASVHFPALVNFTDNDKAQMHVRFDDLCEKISAVIGDRIADSKHRIAENYALLAAGTEIFLQKVKLSDWVAKVEPFVLKVVLPEAIPFYTFRASEAVSLLASQIGESPSTQQQKILTDFCEDVQAVRAHHPNELAGCFKVMPLGEYICIRPDEFSDLQRKTANTVCNVKDLLIQTSAIAMNPQPFPPHTGSKRCKGVPKAAFTDEQLKVLTAQLAQPQPAATLVAVVPRQVLLPSPFKSHTPMPHSGPLATSTQIADRVLDFIRNDPDVSFIRENTPLAGMDLEENDRIPGNSVTTAADARTRDNIIPVSSSGVATVTLARKSEIAANPPGLNTGNTLEPAKKKVAVSEISCAACGKKSNEGAMGKTVPCTECKRRYHIPCQSQHEQHWVTRENARSRRCEECRERPS